MYFGFAKQTEEQPKQIEFRFVSGLNRKKIDCFEDTLVATPLLTAPCSAIISYGIQLSDFETEAAGGGGG
jgi:hypothetical protein